MIGFLRGDLGTPAGGWPEPFRSKALAGRADAKPETPLTADEDEGLARRRRPNAARTLNRLLFPGPAKDFDEPPRAVRGHLGAVGQPVLLRAAAG